MKRELCISHTDCIIIVLSCNCNFYVGIKSDIQQRHISVSGIFLYDIVVRYFIFNRRQYVESGQSAFLSNGVSLRRDVQFPSCSRYRCIQKMSMYV